MDIGLHPLHLNLPPAGVDLGPVPAVPAASRADQVSQSFASLLLTQVLSTLAKTTQASENREQGWVWSLMSRSLAETWSQQEPAVILDAVKTQVQGSE